VLAGHVHELLHADLEGVSYISMPSSGGHLRLSRKYEDGWFFGYVVADVRGANVSLQIQEARPPYGKGRVTRPEDWGITGLRAAAASQSLAALRKSAPAF
jgi:hypothetical protein